MKLKDLQKVADTIVIKSPCSVGWDNMTGDDQIRFCGQCNKNVHNISSLPPKEIEEVLSRAKRKEEVCVLMYKRADGTVIIDNCPVILRKTRDTIRAAYVAVLLAVFWLIGTNADAQSLVGAPVSNGGQLSEVGGTGLVGAPIDPRYGTSGMLTVADFGHYKSISDIRDLLTLLSGLIAITFPFTLPPKSKLRTDPWCWFALVVVPLLIYFVGTYLANNPDILNFGAVQ